jgi:RHS repeat-associated protein
MRTTTTKTPAGLARTVVESRSVTLADANNPFSVLTSTVTSTVNGGSGPAGTSYSAIYDVGKHTRTTSRGGLAVTEVLDDAGRLLTQSAPGLAPVSITYDSFGRPTKIVQSARAVRFDYGTDGFLSTLTDPDGNATKFLHDGAGRVTNQRLPTGDLIQVGFDAAGNVRSVTPPGRGAHLMTYDPDNRLVSYAPPLVGTEPNLMRYFYDTEGKPTHVDFPDGSSVAYGYDAFQRRHSVSQPLDSMVYGYDSAGRVSSLTTAAETLSIGYDGSLLTLLTRSGAVSGKVAYGYDAAFRPSLITLNADSGILYGYDTGGRLLTAGSLTLTRDPQNGLVTGTNLDALTESMPHDEYGEVTPYTVSVAGSSIYVLTLDRYLSGRIKTKTENIAGTTTSRDFVYDLAGRLTDVTVAGVLESHYDYDANGNRLARSGALGSTSATYDEQDRIKTYGSTTYAFSPNGSLTSKTVAAGSTTYVYDLRGNLRSVTLPSGSSVEYIIDGQSRRVGKKVAGSIVQGFLYGKGLGPLAELDSSGATIATFVYAAKVNVPDYIAKGGKRYRVVTDQVGSVRLVVDAANGTVVQRIDYDEFGIVTSDSNPGFQPFGFAGGLYDRDTGLVRFGARDYDPTTGRWSAKDPLSLRVGTNLYAYAGCDPVNLSDPKGLQVDAPDGGAESICGEPVDAPDASFGLDASFPNGCRSLPPPRRTRTNWWCSLLCGKSVSRLCLVPDPSFSPICSDFVNMICTPACEEIDDSPPPDAGPPDCSLGPECDCSAGPSCTRCTSQ